MSPLLIGCFVTNPASPRHDLEEVTIALALYSLPQSGSCQQRCSIPKGSKPLEVLSPICRPDVFRGMAVNAFGSLVRDLRQALPELAEASMQPRAALLLSESAEASMQPRAARSLPSWITREGRANWNPSLSQENSCEHWKAFLARCESATRVWWLRRQVLGTCLIKVQISPGSKSCPLCIILSSWKQPLQSWTPSSLDLTILSQPGEDDTMAIFDASRKLGSLHMRMLHVDSVSPPGIWWDKRLVDPQIVRILISLCRENHSTCNHKNSAMGPTNTRLIDLTTRHLVFQRPGMDYVALSYVNGGAETLQTTRKNVELLSQPGGLYPRPEIGRAVLDAMDFASRLGQQYLWVDSLCIVQDDASQKHEQIMQMDSIYRNAFLTIIAVSGKSADSPLAGISAGSRAPLRADIIDKVHLSAGKDTVEIAVQPPNPKVILERSVFETRGWTFQERVLSPRCLYLTDDQSFFQCRGGWISEAMWATACEYSDSHNPTNDIGFSNPLADVLGIVDPSKVTKLQVWQAYAKSVTLYTPRKLSFLVDIVSAFAGIASVLDQLQPMIFYQGIPFRLLDSALLWYPTGRMQRRALPEIPDKPALYFPSWSWAGWVGPVSYFLEDCATRSPPDSLVDRFTYAKVKHFHIQTDSSHQEDRGIRNEWALDEASAGAQLAADSLFLTILSFDCETI
jgi:hypothetical protein